MTERQSLIHRGKRAMIAAGGTGGHVFPGLSIAEKLQEKGWQVSWIGTEEGMEARLVRKHNILFDHVPIAGLRGKGILRLVFLPLLLLRALYYAGKIMRQRKPDLVVGMGGYVAFAPNMMGAFFGTPVAICEQNGIAGLVNKVCAHIADLRFVAFPNTLANAQWVGNPVLKRFLEIAPPEIRFEKRTGALKVLILGGSRGAAWMNQQLPEIFAKTQDISRFQIVHQTGSNQAESVKAHYQSLGIDVEVVSFIDDMASAYAHADLIVSRAGAMAVTEIACVGAASILIPFPHAVDDHQYINGQYLAKEGAALLFRQEAIILEEMAARLDNITREDCLAMAMKARKLSPGDAAEQIVLACEDYLQRKSS